MRYFQAAVDVACWIALALNAAALAVKAARGTDLTWWTVLNGAVVAALLCVLL